MQTPYILDLNAGLTQVLNDGTSAYVYGLDLVSQQTGIYEEYPLRDALGSVRQVTDQSSAITGSRNYEPYGSLLSSSGEESMAYGFAGEWTDASGMQYLRARYYDPAVGRFVSRDRWDGFYDRPLSLNKWNYVQGNPVNFKDPTGLLPCPYRLWDNSCTPDDYYSLIFNPFLNTVAGSQKYTGQRIDFGIREINVEGATTKEYMNYAYYYGQVMNTISEVGINSLPGLSQGYGFAKLLVNINPLTGQPISPEERVLNAAFLALGGVFDYKGLICKPAFIGSAEEAFDTAISKGILNPKYRNAFNGFVGEAKLVTLQDDLVVLQYTSMGGSTTPWFTIKEYVKAGNAQRYLALPNYNTAKEITQYIIPKGTDIIIGKVASQSDDITRFGSYATGGGFQVYLPELNKAIKLP